MKIEQLTLENFKCFKSEKTFDFSRLTILTGANSSGKSSVMYAILGALQTQGFPYQFSPNGNYINLGDYKEIINNHDENLDFKLSLNFSNIDYTINVNNQWKLDKTDFLPSISSINIVEENEWIIKKYLGSTYNNLEIQIHLKESINFEKLNEYCKDLEDFFKISYDQKDFKVNAIDESNIKIKDFDIIKYNYNFSSEDLVNRSYSYPINPITRFVISSFNPYFGYTLIKFQKELLNFVSAFRKSPQRTYLEQNKASFKIGGEGEEYIDQIVEWDKRSNGKKKELIKTMLDLDLIEDIKIIRLGGGRFEVSIKPVGNKVFSTLNDVGSGVSAFMPIIVADLQLPNDSTLFLAEPEIHLHPTIQSKFGEYIVNNINNTDKNYVIETHSEYFLNKIRLAIVKGELKKEDVKVYFLENNGDDTDVYDIDFTKTGAIKNAPPNFFRTYFLDTMDIALNSFAE
jgi:predicted ATPase